MQFLVAVAFPPVASHSSSESCTWQAAGQELSPQNDLSATSRTAAGTFGDNASKAGLGKKGQMQHSEVPEGAAPTKPTWKGCGQKRRLHSESSMPGSGPDRPTCCKETHPQINKILIGLEI